MARWTATESRTIEAFARSDNALRTTYFRIQPDIPYTAEATYWLDQDELPESFQPEFFLEVDVKALAEETLIEPEDLDLVFVVRDQGIHRWQELRRFPVTALPDCWGPSPSELSEFAVPRSLRFVSLAVPNRRLPHMPGRAFRPQHVVAERSFEVKLRRDGARFPVRVEDENWFLANNLPRETVWTTRWTGSPAHGSSAEVLSIVINKRYEDVLQRLLGSSGSGGAFGANLAVEIFTEVCAVALERATDYSVDESTLQAVVQERLGLSNQQDLERWKAISSEPSDGLAWLRGYAQSILNLGDAITKARP